MGGTVGSGDRGTPALGGPQDIQKVADMVSSTFEKANAYSKVIVGLGYGALLAIWSGTKQVLPQRLLIASGLLVMVSLVVYVLYEVGQMAVNTWGYAKWHSDVEAGGLSVALRRNGDRQKKLVRPLFKIWVVALIISLLTGLGAAGILAYAFCCRLFGHG